MLADTAAGVSGFMRAAIEEHGSTHLSAAARRVLDEYMTRAEQPNAETLQQAAEMLGKGADARQFHGALIGLMNEIGDWPAVVQQYKDWGLTKADVDRRAAERAAAAADDDLDQYRGEKLYKPRG
jgi:hypothetical protein